MVYRHCNSLSYHVVVIEMNGNPMLEPLITAAEDCPVRYQVGS
jgi:hypothetical protein